jgi:hypothetical protein
MKDARNLVISIFSAPRATEIDGGDGGGVAAHSIGLSTSNLVPGPGALQKLDQLQFVPLGGSTGPQRTHSSCEVWRHPSYGQVGSPSNPDL